VFDNQLTSPAVGLPSRATRREVLAWTAGGLLAGGVLAGCGSSSSNAAKVTTSAGRIRPGGALVVGVDGGGSNDSLDPTQVASNTNFARAYQLFEPLVQRDAHNNFVWVLAESAEPGPAAKTWTIRLRRGVEFHNGKKFTAEDVIYTWKRILNPNFPNLSSGLLKGIDLTKTKKLDDYTVDVVLHAPNAVFMENLTGTWSLITPVGFDPKTPVGTGPFKYESFTPGQQSVFVKNPNYWRSGRPYLDTLTISDITDDSARLNALRAGQVDCISVLPSSQIASLQANPSLRALIGPTGNWQPFTMRVDQSPFNDVRVRQAFRLIADREQIVQQALDGQGSVANDMYARYDPSYPTSFPQRAQDIEQAKSLLKAAGRSGVSVQLVTSPIYQGVVEAATVFAQQAKAAGVNIQVKKVDPGSFYGPQYLKYTFAQDYWYVDTFLKATDQSAMPYSSANETHWNDPKFTSLIGQARAELDASKRIELEQAAQKILYDEGGFIIWGWSNTIDAYNTKFTGFVPSKNGIPLGNWGFGDVGLQA
jgi:peptide/nickel transport system substrate-binding protein